MTIPEALAYLRTIARGGPYAALDALDVLEASWRREQDHLRTIGSAGGRSTSDAKREAGRRNAAKARAARLARRAEKKD